MHTQMISDKGAKDWSFQSLVPGKLDIRMQKSEAGPLLHIIQKLTQNGSKTKT